MHTLVCTYQVLHTFQREISIFQRKKKSAIFPCQALSLYKLLVFSSKWEGRSKKYQLLNNNYLDYIYKDHLSSLYFLKFYFKVWLSIYSLVMKDLTWKSKHGRAEIMNPLVSTHKFELKELCWCLSSSYWYSAIQVYISIQVKIFKNIGSWEANILN